MLSFCRLRQRIELMCVPHVQHDYFSSFNQSDYCFLASSLPLPSSLLKLPNRELKQPRRRRQQKPDIFAYLTMKNSILHALHVHISSFDILKTFSFFLRREKNDLFCRCVDDVSI